MPFAPTQTKMRLIGRMPFAPTEEIPPAPAGFALRARDALAQLARSANVCADRGLNRPVKLIRLNPTKMLGFALRARDRERTSTQPTNQGIFPKRRRYCPQKPGFSSRCVI